MGRLHQVAQDHHRVGAQVILLTQPVQGFGDFPRHQRLKEIEDTGAVGQPQHGAGLFFCGRAAAMGDGLVEQRQRIAHRAFGGAGDQHQRLILYGDTLAFNDGFEMRDQHVGGHPAQIKTLAARQNRHRQFANLGGGENKLHMGRWLFQRLQQGVEGVLRQHMHFIDDINLVARRGGGIAHALDNFANVVDAGAAGGIHLQHIHMARFGD